MEKQEWMEKIERQFELQTAEEIDKLLRQCQYYFENDDLIMNIIKVIRKTKNISFNQWKALKAHLSKHNNPTKRL
jgi:hypothetical protein